ncbi:6-phosphofructokinase [Thiomicrospira sp. R3]|uniref:6-phosphofructokinase n=1 Tax=Thiomicrospira sp. R3 TaxID=3035472 RepID=UPI00259B15E1|nr:6-phosphofructokinase [Thiomicrospira sp. R3]WFE67915.1 6-phosphofructokinase [Thiomicrospira sp. R3]
MTKPTKNVLYAQAGGVSAVINASAAGVIETVRQHPQVFGKVYAAINGIKGVLDEALVDIDSFSEQDMARLKFLPGAAFKACRFDLETEEARPDQYQRVLEVFTRYQIGYFFYNGGNGSMLTAKKVADYCCRQGHPVICIGVAKTIDNDLAISHCSPGFGSTAKYLATSFFEACLDIQSMHQTSTRFFVLETMGRNVGWLSLAPGLVKKLLPDLPIIILPAERPFRRQAFLDKVQKLIDEHGYCTCSVSEGVRSEDGQFISVAGVEHAHGMTFTQLGGVAEKLGHLVADQLKIKTHSANPDYLQRSASHMVSQTDWDMAYQAGEQAVIAALNGEHGVLPIITKLSDNPFQFGFKTVPLDAVAELEKSVPDSFITEDGMDITQAALDYLLPLVAGERPIAFKHGMPDISPLQLTHLTKQLAPFKN